MNDLNLRNPRFNKFVKFLNQYPQYGAILVTLELPIQKSLLKKYGDIRYFDLITMDNFFSETQVWYRSVAGHDRCTSFNCIDLYLTTYYITSSIGSLDLDKIYDDE